MQEFILKKKIYKKISVRNISTPFSNIFGRMISISDKGRFCFMARNHSILSPIDSVKDDNQ